MLDDGTTGLRRIGIAIGNPLRKFSAQALQLIDSMLNHVELDSCHRPRRTATGGRTQGEQVRNFLQREPDGLRPLDEAQLFGIRDGVTPNRA